MSIAQAVRDAAVADVREGMSIAAAAKKHGCSVGSVHGWVRSAGGAPNVTSAPRAQRTARAKTNAGGRSEVNAGKARSKVNVGEGGGRREREKAGKRGSEEGGKSGAAEGSRAHPDAELAVVEANLRKAIAQRAEVLANPASIVHKDQVKIAVALDYTVGALKALPGVYQRPAPPVTPQEAEDRIARVFGTPAEEPEPAPSPGAQLIEINGGKA